MRQYILDRRGALWYLVFKNPLSWIIAAALLVSAFTLGVAFAHDNSMEISMDHPNIDVILRYVVQPVILLLLAVVAWFIRTSYSSIEESIRKLHERLDQLNSRTSYLEGVNSRKES